MDQNQNKPTWDEVPWADIERELREARKQKLTHVWLVTCRYEDGTPTCSMCAHFPYSDASRKEFTLDWKQLI